MRVTPVSEPEGFWEHYDAGYDARAPAWHRLTKSRHDGRGIVERMSRPDRDILLRYVVQITIDLTGEQNETE